MEKTRQIRNKLTIGHDNNALMWLVIINAVVFVMLNFIKVVMFLSADDVNTALNTFHRDVVSNVLIPADFKLFLTRPWTLLTYMVCHVNFMLLFSSLLWMWLFGSVLQDMVGPEKIIPIYIYGGIVGGIVFLASSNLITVYANSNASVSGMLGGSASIMAIAAATTTLFPKYRFLPALNGGIPLWIVALIFAAVDYASIATTKGTVALAHLGGGCMGFFYAYQLKHGRDLGAWMVRLFRNANNFANPDKKKAKAIVVSTADKINKDLFYKSEKEPYQRVPFEKQDYLNVILDKINAKGMEALSEEERSFLMHYSEDND